MPVLPVYGHPGHWLIMSDLSPSQQRQQSNRTADGKYTTKQHSEADVDLGLATPQQRVIPSPSTATLHTLSNGRVAVQYDEAANIIMPAQRLDAAQQAWDASIEEGMASDAYDEEDVKDMQAENPYATLMPEDVMPQPFAATNPDEIDEKLFNRLSIIERNHLVDTYQVAQTKQQFTAHQPSQGAHDFDKASLIVDDQQEAYVTLADTMHAIGAGRKDAAARAWKESAQYCLDRGRYEQDQYERVVAANPHVSS